MPKMTRSPVDPEPTALHTRPPTEVADANQDPAYVQTSRSYVGRLQSLLQRIGSALIGGDFTGNARGANALDFQAARGDPAHVAAGDDSICIGSDNRAATALSIAIGRNNEASSSNPSHGSVALGADNTTDGEDSAAIGSNCIAGNHRAIAVGDTAWALGVAALAVGVQPQARADNSIAIGTNAYVKALVADASVALGQTAHSEGVKAAALGPDAHALADHATALGSAARVRLAATTNISGPLVTRRGTLEEDELPDGGAYSALQHGAGALVTIASPTLDLTAAASTSVALPARSRFFVHEIQVLCTAATSVTAQPTVRAGTAGSPAAHLSATATTQLTAAGNRERYHPAAWETGVTDLQASVTVAANATALLGRFIWLGILVEDEA